MPKMTFRTTLSPSHNINTPFQKQIKALFWVVFVYFSVLLDESLQLSEELFNGIKIRGIWRQIHKLNSYISAHLLDSFCVMEGRTVHYQHRLWLWPSATVMEELLDEILENLSVDPWNTC
jgi:hypothetical protein